MYRPTVKLIKRSKKNCYWLHRKNSYQFELTNQNLQTVHSNSNQFSFVIITHTHCNY